MTKLQEMMRAGYASAVSHMANPAAAPAWEDVPERRKKEIEENIRAVFSVLRRPDMNAVMRASGQIAMRPTDVDLAVTHYLDAILKEPQ